MRAASVSGVGWVGRAAEMVCSWFARSSLARRVTNHHRPLAAAQTQPHTTLHHTATPPPPPLRRSLPSLNAIPSDPKKKSRSPALRRRRLLTVALVIVQGHETSLRGHRRWSCQRWDALLIWVRRRRSGKSSRWRCAHVAASSEVPGASNVGCIVRGWLVPGSRLCSCGCRYREA